MIPKLPSQENIEKGVEFTVEFDNDVATDSVSVIAAAIIANNNPDSSFKVISVNKIDTDMEHCAIIVYAIMTLVPIIQPLGIKFVTTKK